jgi:hypothetical protein
MDSQIGSEFLQELPLILAGPILRSTEPESVTVWVALKQACQVELTISETLASGNEIGNSLFKETRSTVALGKFLHIVAVTARSEMGQRLSSDRLYAYDLRFTDSTQQTEYPLEQALVSNRYARVSISYFAHQKPTFALPPQQIDHLRIVHGSCRKPHGDGFDALPILDCLIEEAASQPQQRPHQIFLTGDQIYADDVADPLLWAASNLGNLLLGWDEKLPAGPREAPNSQHYTPRQLRPGERAKVATKQAGFTAGLRNKRAKVNSHLLSLGEYYASYLLAWSPVCWMVPFPKGREMTRDRKSCQRWDREVRDIEQFIHTLWKVRRALANVPVYSIFDDHDVSDDWNLNQAWCLRVYGRPLGRWVVQNALLAYAVFQAWGNTPWQFEANQPGGKLLAAAQAWSDSQGTDRVAYGAIAQYLGMPPSNPHTGLPELIQDDSVLILDRHPETITWHYTLQSQCHEMIVLDTRTWRGYPANGKAIAPPMLLCPTAFKRQLLEPLQKRADTEIPITFIIAPTNVFELQVIDWIHHWQLRRNKVFSTDVGDAWNINYNALAQFLITLFEQRNQVIILSGDIHYSSTVRLSCIDTNFPTKAPKAESVLIQLTSSALKNEEIRTQIIHTRLKEWLLPEKVRHWAGWTDPPTMTELSNRKFFPISGKQADTQMSLPSEQPDWFCALEWIPRNPVQIPTFGNSPAWLMSSSECKRRARWRWLQPFMFWKWRWFQDGREVVGVNNLALVQLKAEPENRAYQVIQDLYWFASGHSTQVVYSRYESQLAPNRSLLKTSEPMK